MWLLGTSPKAVFPKHYGVVSLGWGDDPDACWEDVVEAMNGKARADNQPKETLDELNLLLPYD